MTNYKSDIDPIYQLLGAHHETVVEAALGDEIRDREFVIKAPITDKVVYSGRADFILKDGTIVEAKASLAKGKYKREALPKPSHISQVVSYMMQLEQPYAQIVWGYYKARGGEFEWVGESMYHLNLADNGQVLIDGRHTQYFAQDQLAHMRAAAAALESGDWESVPKPYNWEAKFGSPCHFCPFNKTHCNKGDV